MIRNKGLALTLALVFVLSMSAVAFADTDTGTTDITFQIEEPAVTVSAGVPWFDGSAGPGGSDSQTRAGTSDDYWFSVDANASYTVSASVEPPHMGGLKGWELATGAVGSPGNGEYQLIYAATTAQVPGGAVLEGHLQTFNAFGDSAENSGPWGGTITVYIGDVPDSFDFGSFTETITWTVTVP